MSDAAHISPSAYVQFSFRVKLFENAEQFQYFKEHFKEQAFNCLLLLLIPNQHNPVLEKGRTGNHYLENLNHSEKLKQKLNSF